VFGCSRTTRQIALDAAPIRVEGEQNGVPVGVPVVRINCQWVEVKFGSAKSAKPITR